MIFGCDATICISLERRADRWSRFYHHARSVGWFNIDRFFAIDGAAKFKDNLPEKFHGWEGAMGCTWSHWEIAKRVVEKGWKWALVMEDDCRFLGSISDVQAYFDEARELNPLQIHLGRDGSMHEAEILGEDRSFDMVRKVMNTHAYFMSADLAQRICDSLKDNHLRTDLTIHIDRLISSLQGPRDIVTVPKKEICEQDKSFTTDVKWSCPDHKQK